MATTIAFPGQQMVTVENEHAAKAVAKSLMQEAERRKREAEEAKPLPPGPYVVRWDGAGAMATSGLLKVDDPWAQVHTWFDMGMLVQVIEDLEAASQVEPVTVTTMTGEIAQEFIDRHS